MIKSFLPSATVFTSNGERIIQAIKCIEHRELGDWYVDLVAPLEYQSYLEKDYILVVPTKEKGDQPFRINNPKITDKVDVRAYHIGFDTRNYAVELSTVVNGNAQTCLNTLSSEIDGTHPFTFTSAIATLKNFSVVDSSLYNALIQIADEYNGILDFNGWTVTISSSIGADNGVVLAYGKNIQESEINENWDLVVTKLKPIGNDGILLTPAWLTADVSYDRPYTKIMNFDSDDVSNLGLVAQLYLDRYKVPRVNYKVKADVEQNVALGDAVTVNARQFVTTAEVLSFDYNPLINRVIQVEFGNFRPTLKQFFSDQAQVIEESAYKKARLKIDEAAGIIEAYADNLISLAVGTVKGGQDSIIPYTQDDWEINGYSSSTGLANVGSDFIRTKTTLDIPIKPSTDYILQCSDGLDLTNSMVLYYTSANAFISYQSFTSVESKITTPATASFIKIKMRKSGGGTFLVSEMPNHYVRVVPVGKYLKGARYEFTDTNFAIKNNANETVLTADIAGNLEMIGKVTATSGKIGRFDISGNDLVYTSDLFNKEYDWGDYSKLQRIMAGLDTPTAYDSEVYDVNSTGTLTVTDLVIIRLHVQNGDPLPTPRRQIRSVIRIGTTSGELRTTSVSALGNTGSTFVMKAENLSGELLNVKGISAKGGTVELLDVINGVRFPATFVGSNEANVLDDYEEGTWEPVIHGTTNVGTATYSNVSGKYTKIGNVVHFTARVDWSGHTGTGFMRVSIPITNGDTFATCSIGFSGITYSGIPTILIPPTDIYAWFYTYTSGGGITALSMDSSGSLFISGSYMV